MIHVKVELLGGLYWLSVWQEGMPVREEMLLTEAQFLALKEKLCGHG